MDTHDHKWCYVDPRSQAYKPDVRARRVKQAKGKGVQLPDYLQEESPAVVGNVLGGGYTDDLMGALRLVGALTEDEVQR